MFKIITNNKFDKKITEIINLLNLANKSYKIEVNPLIEFQVIDVKHGEIFNSIEKLTETLQKVDKDIIHD